MDLQLDGKVVAITGGSMGIGKAIAHTMATEGCNIAMCARGQEGLDAAAKEATRLRKLLHKRTRKMMDIQRRAQNRNRPRR